MDSLNLSNQYRVGLQDSLLSGADAFDLVNDPSNVFGTSSFLSNSTVDSLETLGADPSGASSLMVETFTNLTDNVFFQFIVIGLLVFYVYTLFISGQSVSKLYKTLKSTNYDLDSVEITTNTFNTFRRNTKWISFLNIGIISIKLLDYSGLRGLELPLSEDYYFLLIIPFSLLVPLVFQIERIFLALVANITLSGEFIKQLLSIKYLVLSGCAIVTTPLFLMVSFYEGVLLLPMLCLIAILVISLLFLWLYKTYMLFISQSISFLHWFLYLCTVEIFPFTLLIFFLKN